MTKHSQLKAIHAQESLEASARKAKEVAGSLRTSGLADAARVVEEGYMETLTYARFPPEHWRRIRTNNGIERLNREIKRRTKAVASFPDGRAATMLAAARCKYIAEGNRGDQEAPRRQPPRRMGRGGVGRGLGTQVQEVISSPAPVGLFEKNY